MGAHRRQPLTCTIENCDKQTIAKGLCWTHYQRMRRYGRLGLKLRPSYPEFCQAPDCDKKAHCRGLCVAHYQRLARYGRLDKKVWPLHLCSVPGCGRKHTARGLCSNHYYLAAEKRRRAEEKASAQGTSVLGGARAVADRRVAGLGAPGR